MGINMFMERNTAEVEGAVLIDGWFAVQVFSLDIFTVRKIIEQHQPYYLTLTLKDMFTHFQVLKEQRKRFSCFNYSSCSYFYISRSHHNAMMSTNALKWWRVSVKCWVVVHIVQCMKGNIINFIWWAINQHNFQTTLYEFPFFFYLSKLWGQGSS